MKVNKKAIKDFINTWKDQGSEVADKVTYWNTLLELIGVPRAQIDNKTFIEYEKPIKLNKNEQFHGSIDAYIPSTRVLIEQKSNGVDLSKPEARPNGGHFEKVTPFAQAKRYNDNLGSNEKANFLVLCNFSQIIFYDIRDTIDADPVTINIEDLEKDLYLLDFLVKKDESKRIKKEEQISFAAGELVKKIYDELTNIFAKYDQADDEKIKHSINMLCVRLVFCLYAEDAKLFPIKEQFYNYLEPIEPNKMGLALKALFKTLDTEDRTKDDPFWEDEHPELSQFPYVNGGLFKEADVIIPPFTPKLKDILLNEASRQFDWSGISPTIFGGVFESTLNPETRRQGGMHYTSIENIHKVIDPLFLDDLKAELERIKQYKNRKTIEEKALAFQEKLGQLTFFDPASGSGNFLTETFLSLRRLENEAIRLQTHGESLLDVGQADDWIHVSIQQFSGIEINDFAVSVSKTALWIAEDQMQKETRDLLYANDWHFLPLKTNARIHEGDALQMDWNKVLPNYACHYLVSNPPFIGARLQTKDQKAEIKELFGKKKGVGNIDYVAGWYKKAADYIQNTKIQCAFVSTNSIIQGEQTALIWENLLKEEITFNFAYQTFGWNSEAKDKARVHVVIIGFSDQKHGRKNKILYSSNETSKVVKHINNYLLDANDVFLHDRTDAISAINPINYGSFALDDGNYTISNKEYDELVEHDQNINQYLKPFIGARELMHNMKRYCVWLKDMSPALIKKDKIILQKVENVRQWRSESKRKNTRELADTPTLFAEIRQPNTNYLAIPTICSEKREYIPMMYLTPDIIASNQLYVVPNATLYDFGVLESSTHMSWMRTVAGRLELRYRYSSKIVYNNFPWVNPTDKQKEKIEKTAQAILDARANHSESSLADLYDPNVMPPDLRKAHKANDKAILQLYGLSTDTSEQDIVAHLFKLYEDLTKQKD